MTTYELQPDPGHHNAPCPPTRLVGQEGALFAKKMCFTEQIFSRNVTLSKKD
jgi:hypothetical protein